MTPVSIYIVFVYKTEYWIVFGHSVRARSCKAGNLVRVLGVNRPPNMRVFLKGVMALNL